MHDGTEGSQRKWACAAVRCCVVVQNPEKKSFNGSNCKTLQRGRGRIYINSSPKNCNQKLGLLGARSLQALARGGRTRSTRFALVFGRRRWLLRRPERPACGRPRWITGGPGCRASLPALTVSIRGSRHVPVAAGSDRRTAIYSRDLSFPERKPIIERENEWRRCPLMDDCRELHRLDVARYSSLSLPPPAFS